MPCRRPDVQCQLVRGEERGRKAALFVMLLHHLFMLIGGMVIPAFPCCVSIPFSDCSSSVCDIMTGQFCYLFVLFGLHCCILFIFYVPFVCNNLKRERGAAGEEREMKRERERGRSLITFICV